jgi:hypothetical protein
MNDSDHREEIVQREAQIDELRSEIEHLAVVLCLCIISMIPTTHSRPLSLSRILLLTLRIERQ